MEKCLMGIDVGTTGTKVIVFDLQGNILASAYREYECSYPHPNWVEQDCSELIEAVYYCCQKSAAGIDTTKYEISGVSVSAQRSSVVFLDEQGKPIKMISWQDNRAVREVEEIEQKAGKERFYEITGLPLCATWILPKILYIRKNDRDVWEKTQKIAQLQDVVLRALGVDEYYSDESEAGFWGVWDNRYFRYSEELLEAFDIDIRMLPEVKAFRYFGRRDHKGSQHAYRTSGGREDLCGPWGSEQCGHRSRNRGKGYDVGFHRNGRTGDGIARHLLPGSERTGDGDPPCGSRKVDL